MGIANLKGAKMRSTVSSLLFTTVAVFCVCLAQQDPNSYNGLGHVVCAGKMMVPHTEPCNAANPCQGKLMCAPKEQDQFFTIHQDDGEDQIVTSGKGHVLCDGKVSYVLDQNGEMPYCQNLDHSRGLFCGYATCEGTIDASWSV